MRVGGDVFEGVWHGYNVLGLPSSEPPMGMGKRSDRLSGSNELSGGEKYVSAVKAANHWQWSVAFGNMCQAKDGQTQRPQYLPALGVAGGFCYKYYWLACQLHLHVF
jgi:hypothetical protein